MAAVTPSRFFGRRPTSPLSPPKIVNRTAYRAYQAYVAYAGKRHARALAEWLGISVHTEIVEC
jgi:hypothetical protein